MFSWLNEVLHFEPKHDVLLIVERGTAEDCCY